MRPLTIDELQERSTVELDVLYTICSEQIRKSAAYDTAWLAATMTAGRIIRLRSMVPDSGTRQVA